MGKEKFKCSHTDVKKVSELLLIQNPKNNNKHSKEQIDRLAKIIDFQGQRSPIVISKRSGFIVKGHGRLFALDKLKWSEAAVDYQDYNTEAEEYADMTADNEIARWAEFNTDKFLEDIKTVDLGDFELLGLKELPDILGEDKKELTDPDEIPEVVEPKAKLGQIYKLGEHRLMCGDSTKEDHVYKLMDGELADFVFTDPPYGVNYDGGHAEKGKRREKLANDDSTLIYDGSIPMMEKFSKEKAALYLWFAATKSLQVLQVLQSNKYEIRSWLIWNKNMAQFGAIGAQYKQKHEPCLYCYKSGSSPFWDGPNNEVSVWDIKRSSKNEYHPTQKPVELSERAINNSCPKNGIVLDLFGGSGSTMIGAEMTSRKARLMELNPAYVDVIITRWENFTGKKAELLNG